jgi:hypothetical protein
MQNLLSNKWVLYGGAGLLALIVGYTFLSSGSASSDEEGGDPTGGLPMVLGGYGPVGAGTAGSTGIATDNSVELLANLEKAKAEMSYNVNMADIAATLSLGLSSLVTQRDIAFDTNRTQLGVAGLDFASTIMKQGNVAALVGGVNIAPNNSGISFNLAKIFENPVRQSDGTVYNANTSVLGGMGAYNASTGPGSTYAKGFGSFIPLPALTGSINGIPQSYTSAPINPASSPTGTITGYAGSAQSPSVPRVGASPNTAYASNSPASSPSSVQPASGLTTVNPVVRSGSVSSPVASVPRRLSKADQARM